MKITILSLAEKERAAQLRIMAYHLQQDIKAGIFPLPENPVNIGAILNAPAQALPDPEPDYTREMEQHQARINEGDDLLAALGTPEEITAATTPRSKLDILLRTDEEGARRDIEEATEEMVDAVPIVAQEINYNENQRAAIAACLNFSNTDIVLIGSAGTGKTTTEYGIVAALSQVLPKFAGKSKTIPPTAPAIVVTCPTNRGLHPIRRTIGKLIPSNICTNHRLQEYEPVFFEVPDGEGGFKKTMRFEPMRGASNPIPELEFHIKDESGLLSVQMDAQDRAALPNARRLYVGDIYQLPPIYGQSILGYQLARAAKGEIPLVELTEVYRQALDSPILARAIEVKNGKCASFLKSNCTKKWKQEHATGTLVFTPIPDKFAPQLPRASDEDSKAERESGIARICKIFGTSFQKSYLSGEYNPDEDVILIPHRKPHTFGAWQLNRYIAQAISDKENKEVHEIVAGFQKYYFCIGDRVTDGKIEAVVTKITKNKKYYGRKFREPTTNIDRWGHSKTHEAGPDIEENELALDGSGMSNAEIDAFLLQDIGNDKEERKQVASHTIWIKPAGSDFEIPIDTAAGVNELTFAYVLTCHQSQGSEWRRVYLILHSLHSGMYSRELLYTAMTRAKEYCEIIARPSALELCVNRAIIKGVTLAEKAEYFKGKLMEAEAEAQM